MVHKKNKTQVTFKFKNFHMPSKKKAPNSSGMNHKTPQTMVNATKLPRVRVSLTRLMPIKMPDIAKEQYYKLVKSSDLLSVVPAENSTWDTLSSVPKDAPDIPVHRPHPKESLRQTIGIPFQPVDTALSTRNVDRGDSPVFERNEMGITPARKLSVEKKSGAVEKKGLKRKLGRPKKQRKVLELTNSVDLKNSNDKERSRSPLATGVQPSERENTEERKSECEEETSQNDTKLVAEKRSVKKGIAKKVGRPRKRRRLHSFEAPALSDSVEFHYSKDSSKSILLCEPSNDEVRSPFPLATGVQPSEQEDTEERKSDCEEGTSENNTKFVAEKRSVEKGIAKKVGRPRKRSSDSSKSSLLREPSNDDARSSSPPATGVQASEQEDTEEYKRKCDVETSENNTKFVAEKRSVEKGIAQKVGRPRKRSSDSSKSSLPREPSNDEVRSPFPPATGVQASEQEDTEEHKRKCDVETSENNTKFVAEKRSVEKGIAKKVGRPRKRSSDSSKSSLLREPSNDDARSSSPLATGVQASEQEDTEERKRKCDVETSENITKFVAEKRSMEKGIAKKVCRPRKRKRLHSVEAPALPNSMDLNCSNDNAKSTLIREPSEQHEKREQQDETCQNEVRVSPVILETTIGTSKSQERAQMTENREYHLNPQIVEDAAQRSGTPHQHTPILIEIETPSSEGSDLHSSESEVTFKQMPVEDDDQVRETAVSPQRISKWLSAVNIETSPLITSLELNKKQNGAKSPPKVTVFLQDQGEMRQISSNSESNNNIKESIQQDRLISARQELFPDKRLSVNVNVSNNKLREREPSVESTTDPRISPSPLKLIINGGLPISSSNGNDTNSGQENTELLEGKVHIVPCSPIRLSKSPAFEGRQRTFSSSSIASCRSDTARNGTISSTEKSSTSRTNLDGTELSKTSFGRPRKSSMNNRLPQTHSPTLCSTISKTSLLDGAIRLAPCSPVQSPRISTLCKQRKVNERRTSAGHRNSSVSPPNGFKTPVPLKEFVVKCDRVAAESHNILKIPENLLAKFLKQKPKRKRQKVEVEKKTMDEKKKAGKTGKKRKKKNNSNEKPRKKRMLSIPNHYKSYKPSQLPTISHTNMRYRVAFTLWPQKYSGALDKINQRLINQNSFWKSLG